MWAASSGMSIYSASPKRTTDQQNNLLRTQFLLTQREAEVLLWLARGKSNRDIAEIWASVRAR
jgi:DNA-binding CsgD family transcriptional regulator